MRHGLALPQRLSTAQALAHFLQVLESPCDLKVRIRCYFLTTCQFEAPHAATISTPKLCAHLRFAVLRTIGLWHTGYAVLLVNFPIKLPLIMSRVF
jgi:hypothetical protein